MTNIECPWCHKVNECEVWELKPGKRFEDEQCRYCNKYFGYNFDFMGEYRAFDVRKVEAHE